MAASTKALTGREIVLFGFLALFFGTTFFYAEVALTAFGPLTIVSVRLTVAASILWIIVALLGLQPPRGMRPWGRLLVMGVINNALPFSCIVWAQMHITSGVAGILNATTPLFVLVFAHLLTSDERMSWRKLLAVLIGLGGVMLMIGPAAVAQLDPTSVGQFVMLSTSVMYAFAAIWGRKLRDLHPLVAATGTLTLSAIILVPLALTLEGVPSGWPPVEVALAMTGLSVLSTVCAYSLYFHLLNRVGSTNLILVTFLVPIVALVFGTLVLRETVSNDALLGMATVGIALTLVDGRILRPLERVRAKLAPALDPQ